MATVTLKEIIEQHKGEILMMSEKGRKKADIVRHLITTHKLAIPYDKVDNFRRGISRLIQTSDEEKELDSVLSSHINVYTDKSSGPQDMEDDGLSDDEIKKALRGAYEHKEKFWFISESDSYYFNIPGYPNAMKFSGTLIREMKNKYSKLGVTGGLTINELCRSVKIPRDIIIYIKTYLGWTHDSDPFTNEEMLSGDIDEMVTRTLEDRKFQWFQKYSRKEQRELANAANMWYQFKANLVNPFVEAMVNWSHEYHAHPVQKFEKAPGRQHALVVGPFDLHFGKYAWEGDTGNTYNRRIARDLLLNATKEIMSEVAGKNIEKVIIPVGSDFFHVDTVSNTTTRGTPQDVDGTLVQIMVEGQALMVEFIDKMRQIADVELILAAGNHDYILSHALLEHLSAYYRNCDDVTVKRKYHFRQYTMYGNTLLGFTHGDESKLTDLAGLMAKEAKEMWGKHKFAAFFTGHLHHEMSKDYNGVKVYQMPSLAGADRWHHKKGYTGSVKGMGAYLVDREKGVRVTVMENI